MKRLGWPAIVAAVPLAVILVFVIAGDALTPYPPNAQQLELSSSGPTGQHWLGTDDLGRDVLSRVISGARVAVIGPLLVALVAVVVGISLGLAAAYYRGRVDSVISRLVDVLYALPALLVAIVVVGISSGGYVVTVLVLALLSMPTAIRMIRSAATVQSGLPYVEAAQSLRLPARTVMFRHLLPNIVPTVVATFLLDFVVALIAFSALAFLGIGGQPGSAEWGVMIAEGREQILSEPWLSLAPAVMIILTAVCATVLGDSFYDRLTAQREAR
ncbi:ABC transporter permease [Amycolatopsis jejuensis]|uniref:ABC transporter permease n=1 Tax=Amycolatopsis jejuensis TaxID=330084 RepID=UPI00052606DD|nr:ABC transporter permease [Amycolatopsis jejuensis]